MSNAGGADAGPPGPPPPRPAVAFVGGALVAGVVFAMLVGYFVWRVGFSALVFGLPGPVMEPESRDVVDLPEPVRQALMAEGSVIANAANPTEARRHQTFVVEPDPDLGYRLRRGLRVDGHVLRARNSMNIDPPMLYRPADAPLPDVVRDWLASESRLAFSYGIDDQGRRITLPVVQSDHRILMVGDSVMFGVGVDDDETPASTLQARLGDRAQVVNAGVGGYQAWQALLVAERMAKQGPWDALIYFTSQNDFVLQPDEHFPGGAKDIVPAFGKLAPQFGGHVLLVVVPYLEVVAADVLLRDGWTPEMVEESRALFRQLPELAHESGVVYVDWMDVDAAWRRRAGTVFAPFALFADHTHLSPFASRLTAEHLAGALQPALGAGGTSAPAAAPAPPG